MRRAAALLALLVLLFSGYVTARGSGEPELQASETGHAETTNCVQRAETLAEPRGVTVDEYVHSVETVETVRGEVMTGTIIIERVRVRPACAGLVLTLKEPTTTFLDTAVPEQE